MYCSVPYCIALFCSIPYCIVLFCTVLYHTVLYRIASHCSVLYRTASHCSVPYCITLFCTVLEHYEYFNSKVGTVCYLIIILLYLRVAKLNSRTLALSYTGAKIQQGNPTFFRIPLIILTLI